MEEQARLSQLAFDGDDGESLQWSTDGWPRLLDGWRFGHASIVIGGDGTKESILVLGGYAENGVTDSVLVMNTTEKKFRQGPSMSKKRCYFAARKVNIGVYACGGSNNSDEYLDTIERINVNDLLEAPVTSTTACKWEILPCRLTSPRFGCTACDVINRYLVIVGGYNSTQKWLSSVDILDTGGDGNNHTIVVGIDMNCARRFATSEVIGTRMFVVGGQGYRQQWLRSVEYVEFGCHDNSCNISAVFQTNSCWTLDNTLDLSQGRSLDAMAKLRKCLIVASGSFSSASVEVLDTERHVVWSLPSMTRIRQGCSMVALSKSIVVIGGLHEDSMELLSIRQNLGSFQKSMEEQARLSHLTFDSNSKPPRWSTDGLPRLLGGWRYGHASIVIGEGNKESIIVLGGWTENDVTDSVLVMNTTDKQFQEGPFMSEGRYDFAVRKVNIGVYACGGLRTSCMLLNTIERIDVNDLLEAPASSTICKWKTLPCRLTTPRQGCTACDVMDRYLVIVGGYNGSTNLSSVDILDTGGDGNHHTIVAGIDMNCARRFATAEVIGTRMFVVSGYGHNGQWLCSVEYYEFGCHDNSGNVSSVFQANSSWTLDNDLAVSKGIDFPAMAKIGKCLIVADGNGSPSVEVLDTDRHVVWSLPSKTKVRYGCSMVALSKSIVVIGGFLNDSLESLPIRLSKQEQLKVQSGEIPAKDKKATTQQSAAMANLAPLPQTDSFYAKLVEASDDPMTGKVHELSALLLHVYHVKVFYTFLSHLCRSGLIALEYRRRYTTKALKVITTTIRNAPEQEQEMFAAILEKAVKDGALSEIDFEEIKQHHETTGSPKRLTHEADVRQHLAAMQFRVGKVHGQPIIDDTKPPPSSDADDKNHQKKCILPEVHVLGLSLNQLQTAYYKGRHEEVAVAAICSILNACRFGANVPDQEQNKQTGMPTAPRPLVLPRLVDFGDIHHIGDVVEQSGVLSAQRAFAEGIALLDEALAAAEQKEMTAGAATNLVQHPRTGSLSSLDIWVAVMSKFANAVSQWYKKHDGNCGSNEEVTILALAVTAKLVQASEARYITTPTQTFFDSSNFECQKGNNHSSVHDSSHAFAATRGDSTSNMRVPAAAVQNKQPRSIVARVERLESTMGNCFSLVQRISALEGNCGLDGTTGMTLADRVSQLEDLVLKDRIYYILRNSLYRRLVFLPLILLRPHFRLEEETRELIIIKVTRLIVLFVTEAKFC